MTRSELIARVAYLNKELSMEQVEEIVHKILTSISQALEEGGRVELRGFGTFSVRKRDSRIGRNPRTGESVQVTEKVVPFFKTGKELRQLLNT